MGRQEVVIGPDWKNSGFGLGNINWVETFAQKAGVSSAPYQALYNSLVAANIWNKILFLATFPGSTSASQKYVFSEIPIGGSFPEIIFHGNGSSSNGFTTGASTYAELPFTLPAGNYSNLISFIYSNAIEPTPAGGTNAVMLSTNGDVSLGSVANHRIELGRHWGNPVTVLGKIGTRDGATVNQTFPAGGTYPMTGKGLFGIAKEGNTLELIDGATTVTNAKNDATQVPTGGGSRKLLLGQRMNNSGIADGLNFSQVPFQLAGVSTMTRAEYKTIFKPIIDTFMTALGRQAA